MQFKRCEADIRFSKFRCKTTQSSFFLLCMKLCILTNSEMLISNMEVVFENSSPKEPQQINFSSKFVLALYPNNTQLKYFWTKFKERWNLKDARLTLDFPSSSLKLLKVVFLFWMELCILTNSGMLISKMETVF